MTNVSLPTNARTGVTRPLCASLNKTKMTNYAHREGGLK